MNRLMDAVNRLFGRHPRRSRLKRAREMLRRDPGLVQIRAEQRLVEARLRRLEVTAKVRARRT